MATFYELFKLLESQKLIEAEISPESQARIDAIFKNRPKMGATKTPAEIEKPSVPSKPSLPAMPALKKPSLHAIPNLPEKGELEKEKKPEGLKGLGNFWKRPENKEERILWAQEAVRKITDKNGFNDWLASKTYQYYTRYFLNYLNLDYRILDERGDDITEKGLPRGRVQITLDRPKLKTDFPQILLDTSDALKLVHYVNKTVNAQNQRSPDWEKINKGKAVQLKDYIMRHASENPHLEDLAFRAAQFEKVIMRPSILGFDGTIEELTQKFQQEAGAKRGGLSLPEDDVEAVIYLLDAAKEGNFPFFDVYGDLRNPKTRIHVRSAIELGADTKNESLVWLDIMNLMEHWEF